MRLDNEQPIFKEILELCLLTQSFEQAFSSKNSFFESQSNQINLCGDS